MKNWRTPENCKQPLMVHLGSAFEDAQNRKPDIFPNLRADSHHVIAMDYSGEHSESPFHVLTFLLADRASVLEWDAKRLHIRETLFRDNRRIEYKKLSDSVLQKAVFPFLNATTALNGIVFCVAVDKSIKNTTLGYPLPDNPKMKPSTAAKLIRIAAFGSLLVGGLAETTSHLMWITDEDEIVSNDEFAGISGAVVSKMLRLYCPSSDFATRFGIAGKFDDARRAEDLCAVSDLVGGAISDSLGRVQGAIPHSAGLFTSTGRLPTKVSLINAWIGGLQSNLKNICCVVRDLDGKFEFNFFTPNCRIAQDFDGRIWTPPDKGWMKTFRSRREYPT